MPTTQWLLWTWTTAQLLTHYSLSLWFAEDDGTCVSISWGNVRQGCFLAVALCSLPGVHTLVSLSFSFGLWLLPIVYICNCQAQEIRERKKKRRECPLGIISLPVLEFWFLLAPGAVTVIFPTGMLERRGSQENGREEKKGAFPICLCV